MARTKQIHTYVLMAGFWLLASLWTSEAAAQGKKKKQRAGTLFELSENDRFQSEYYFVEGQKFFILENYAKAYEFFTLSNDINPQNSGVHYKLAQVLIETGNLEEALLHANKALNLDNTNKYCYLLAAEIHTSRAAFQEAAGMYEKMINTLPNNQSYLLDLAALYIYQNKLDKAMEVYNRAESFFGVLEEITYQKQQIYIKEGKIEMAIVEGQKLVDSYPEEPNYKLTLADVLIDNEKEKEAIPYLEAVLRDSPGNPQASVKLSEIYRKNGETGKAMKSLHLAFSDPTLNANAKVQLLAGYIALLPNPDLETAIKDLANDLMKAHPDFSEAFAVAGDMEFRLGNKPRAKNHYVKALELDNANYNLWQNVISIEMETEDYESAARHADQAIEIFPNQALLYYFSGTAYLLKKKYSQAVSNFESAKKLASADPGLSGFIIGQLGDAYNGLKEFAKSDTAYEEALKINPDNDYVLNNYSYYLSLRKENLERALELSQKLVQKYPDNSTYLDTHAWVLYVKGDYKAAQQYLEEAIKDSINLSGTIVEHYGDVLFRLDRVEEAVAQWKKAKSMKDTSELIDKKIADRKLYEK